MRTTVVFIAYIGLLAASATGQLLLGVAFLGVGAYTALTTPKS